MAGIKIKATLIRFDNTNKVVEELKINSEPHEDIEEFTERLKEEFFDMALPELAENLKRNQENTNH